MSFTPELTEALASSPTFSRPPPTPPEGVSLHEFARQQARINFASFSNYYRGRLPADSEYSVTDKTVPVEDGPITVRCLTPTSGGENAVYPVLVWFHGGGWILGDIGMDDNYLRTICVELQLAVVNVEYRLAPENPFPTPFNDCYTALKWVAENASNLHLSLDKGFLVGGDSAGGNLSAAVALKARDDPFFSSAILTGQYLREPAVVHPHAYPDKFKSELLSFGETTESPFLNNERAVGSAVAYGAPPTDLRISPLLATSHAGLPPAFFQVMQLDPLRDDGIVYEKVLRDAGVETKIVRYDGVAHGVHYSFPGLATSVKVDRDARDGLKWLLSLRK